MSVKTNDDNTIHNNSNEMDIVDLFELKIKENEKRFLWLDQYRGLCVLLYIVGILTWNLSGDILTNVLPVGPSYYNHGYALSYEVYGYNPLDFPPIITIIDLGQPILVFLIAFMQAYSFRKKERIFDRKTAWMHTINRFLLILSLSVIFEDMILGKGIFIAFFDGILALIAWSSLIGGLSAALIKNSNNRLIIGIIILIIHFIMYAIPGLNTWSFGKDFYILQIPWRLINLCAISFIASAITGYFFNNDGGVKLEGDVFKKKIIPISLIMFISNFLLDFLQWANNIHCTTSFACLAIAIACLGIFIFYQFEQIQLTIPFLTSFGKNMWVMFIISPIIEWILIDLVRDLVISSSILALIIIGILPIVILGSIAKLLEKKNILLKI